MSAAAAGSTAAAAGYEGLLCGLAFGFASPLSSHPFDTIKTRMQASPSCARGSALAALKQTVAEGGLRALYRGLAPPLVGSVLYRSTQMGMYSYSHEYLAAHAWARRTIPGTGGLELRVLIGGACATTARAIVETPLELLKVRAQLRAPWPRPRELFTGFALTWSRLYIALGSFFVLLDTAERNKALRDIFATPVIGPFLKGGVAATVGWWLAWPLEVAKSLRQSGKHSGSALALLRGVVRERGIMGLYRGLGPGSARSMVGNGSALLAYDACKSCFRADLV